MTDVYSYGVKFYDEIDNKNKTARGILFADGFSGAVEDYYGKNQIIEIKSLRDLYETEVLELEDATIKLICEDIKKGNY